MTICEADRHSFSFGGMLRVIFDSQKGNNPQNLFLLVPPVCQDTPCKMLGLYDHLCSSSTLIFTITSLHQSFSQKGYFLAPETKQGQVGGGRYQLVMAQGIR